MKLALWKNLSSYTTPRIVERHAADCTIEGEIKGRALGWLPEFVLETLM